MTSLSAQTLASRWRRASAADSRGFDEGFARRRRSPNGESSDTGHHEDTTPSQRLQRGFSDFFLARPPLQLHLFKGGIFHVADYS